MPVHIMPQNCEFKIFLSTSNYKLSSVPRIAKGCDECSASNYFPLFPAALVDSVRDVLETEESHIHTCHYHHHRMPSKLACTMTIATSKGHFHLGWQLSHMKIGLIELKITFQVLFTSPFLTRWNSSLLLKAGRQGMSE